MVKKLVRNVLCVGMACVMMATTVVAQPHVTRPDCEWIVITPFDIYNDKDRVD